MTPFSHILAQGRNRKTSSPCSLLNVDIRPLQKNLFKLQFSPRCPGQWECNIHFLLSNTSVRTSAVHCLPVQQQQQLLPLIAFGIFWVLSLLLFGGGEVQFHTIEWTACAYMKGFSFNCHRSSDRHLRKCRMPLTMLSYLLFCQEALSISQL